MDTEHEARNAITIIGSATRILQKDLGSDRVPLLIKIMEEQVDRLKRALIGGVRGDG